jgi:hypothetical protein
MKKLLEILFNVKPAEPVGLTYISRREPMIVTPEFQAWCIQFNVSVLADKRSANIPVTMGDKIKYVNLQSI